MSSTRLSLLGDRGGVCLSFGCLTLRWELECEQDGGVDGFGFFLQMGFTLILATLNGLDVGGFVLGVVIGGDELDDVE
ncbi:hypothetical protein Tco_0732827 [Tanacetum coccineum]